ncbi:MAG: c-type cytochrome [Planctomycetales bacterium]|nr:c-type cytochrome [Planctomycetales bacterium]
MERLTMSGKIQFVERSARFGLCLMLCFASGVFAQEEAAPDASQPQVWSQAPQVEPSKSYDEVQKGEGKQDIFWVRPGFQIELLYTVPKDTQGSWVSMTFDPKGRILACDQGDKGVYRITPATIGSDQATQVEKLSLEMTSAQGMLCAFDALYFSVNGGPGSGLYKATDTDGDDQYDDVQLLKKLDGGGEHGPHALRLSPDGKSIYLVAGNHTDPPSEITASRILTSWNEDLLLPRQWDARGHARGKLAPGGWIAKTDPAGKTWEIISMGYRNPYDIDFNEEGELFAYDADMEWDFGMPWYRPTRIVHAASGSEFGWRSGTGKWPTYFVDSLPPAVEIGPGSPTGVTFGTGTKFPTEYQKAIYLLDWTFGTMYAIHLTPQGASYVGEKEEFISRAALPLTDAAVGPDGALYFTVGGRGTQSALYRATYVGDESTSKPEMETKDRALRQLRRVIESYHPTVNAAGEREAAELSDSQMQVIWDALGHADRHIRYAARLALECRSIELWMDRVLEDAKPRRRIEGLVGLIRATSDQISDETRQREIQAKVVAALLDTEFNALDTEGQLALLRTYSLAFIRLGKPDRSMEASVVAELDPQYPAGEDELNTELSGVLIYLNSPTVIQKTLTLMQRDYAPSRFAAKDLLERNPGYGNTIAAMLSNQPEIQKLHFAFVLRNMRYGWTLDERKQYFAWLDSAKGKSGGASYNGFIENIRKEAFDNLSEAEKLAIESNTDNTPPAPDEIPAPIGPGQEWTVDQVVELVGANLSARSFENGKRTFAAAKCATCHRFDGQGGATGPDLTSVAARFSPKDLAESLIHPSKVISDQYRASVIETSKGTTVTGRIVSESDEELVVQINPEDATKIETIKKTDVESNNPSATSLMPEQLLNALNPDEVKDLFAYLLSRGNPDDLMFAQAAGK